MTYCNFAVGDVRYRRGKDKFTGESYYDLANRLLGQYQAFAMWLQYDESFMAYSEENDWSCKGWTGGVPASFTMFPVDFDASGNLDLAFEHCRKFVQTELLDRGIDTRYFAIYLSGGKGFHVEISASVLDVQLPTLNAGYRIRALASEWLKTYDTLDMTVYNSTSLFRLPGSKHKSGLYKTEIPWDLFTLDYIAARGDWASGAPTSVRIPELGDPPVKLELPEMQITVGLTYSAEVDFDPNATIVPNCVWLQRVLEDPSAGGKDGTGRENRRNAVGILLSGHKTSEHNSELQSYVSRLADHDYMTKARMDDVAKWIREYDKDGEIKCKKTCYAVGCSAPQRKTCGTRSPLDWKLKKKSLDVISVDTARQFVEAALRQILTTDGNGIYVADFPVGIGKTFYMLQLIVELGLTAFYAAQTHQLALQSHSEFVNLGLNSRHVASRTYLTAEEDFVCLFPNEVEMAIRNGYGSHTVCAMCPRKRKRQDGVQGMEPDVGYEPCDYWEQFEGLTETDIVVGVHNHLFEFIYEAAGIAERSITVMDESPLEALGKTISPIEYGLLKRLREALAAEIADLTASATADFVPSPAVGKFGRVAQIMERDLAISQAEETQSQLELLGNFSNLFAGKMFDFARFANMKEEQQRAIWYDVANRLSLRTGLGAECSLPDDKQYLAVPYVLPSALQLAARNIVYNPEHQNYLPATLPPNKILILDATANNDAYAPVMQSLMGTEVRPYSFVSLPLVEQPYSEVTQITSSSYGVSVLLDEETRTYLLYVILELMKKHGGTSLIVCHKQHAKFWKDAFRNDPNVSVGTYGALKGLNHWTGCTAQYIVGTPFVPDVGIRDLAAKLGHDVPLAVLQEGAKLKKVLLLAKNGDTAVISRRYYANHPFHSAIAQMRSQWEVTQAVRLRLYNKPPVDKQFLYVFSNVELKSMYADKYHTLSELAWELTKEANAQPESGRKPLELTGVVYERLTEIFDGWPKGRVFVKADIRDHISIEDCSDRYLQYWLQMTLNANWTERVGSRKYKKVLGDACTS